LKVKSNLELGKGIITSDEEGKREAGYKRGRKVSMETRTL